MARRITLALLASVTIAGCGDLRTAVQTGREIRDRYGLRGAKISLETDAERRVAELQLADPRFLEMEVGEAEALAREAAGLTAERLELGVGDSVVVLLIGRRTGGSVTRNFEGVFRFPASELVAPGPRSSEQAPPEPGSGGE